MNLNGTLNEVFIKYRSVKYLPWRQLKHIKASNSSSFPKCHNQTEPQDEAFSRKKVASISFQPIMTNQNSDDHQQTGIWDNCCKNSYFLFPDWWIPVILDVTPIWTMIVGCLLWSWYETKCQVSTDETCPWWHHRVSWCLRLVFPCCHWRESCPGQTPRPWTGSFRTWS